MEEVGLFETLYSLPHITRYKPDSVPREALDPIIDAATTAPNGGNKQSWKFIVEYPQGRFGPTSRRPAKEVTSDNRYGNRA